MDAYDLITQKIGYNQWANDAIIKWLKEQSTDLYKKEVASSFPNINKVLHHMMEAQTYYLSILKGTEGVYDEELSTARIFEQLLEVDQQLVIWFSNQNVDLMDAEISFKRSPFVETYAVATLITHMLNHNTYHRGQIVAMRHQLGISPPPRTDYYRYFINRNASGQQRTR